MPTDPVLVTSSDPHRERAAEMFGCTPVAVTDTQRQIAKTSTFQERYGVRGRRGSILEIATAVAIGSLLSSSFSELEAREAAGSAESRERREKLARQRRERAEESAAEATAARVRAIAAYKDKAAPIREIAAIRAAVNRIKQGPRAGRAEALQRYVDDFNVAQLTAHRDEQPLPHSKEAGILLHQLTAIPVVAGTSGESGAYAIDLVTKGPQASDSAYLGRLLTQRLPSPLTTL